MLVSSLLLGRHTAGRSDPGPHGVGYEDDDQRLLLHQSPVHRAGVQGPDGQTGPNPTAATGHRQAPAAVDRKAGLKPVAHAGGAGWCFHAQQQRCVKSLVLLLGGVYSAAECPPPEGRAAQPGWKIKDSQ